MDVLYNQPGVAMWFVAPFDKQCRDTFDNKLLPALHQGGRLLPDVRQVLRGSPRMLRMKNGNFCVFQSAENYQSLRGSTLTHLVMDEAAFARPQAWDLALAPMLMRRGRTVIFASTPNGKNHYYDLYLRGRDEAAPDWGVLESGYDETDNPTLQAYVAALKPHTAPDYYRQEYEAEFLDGGGQVFTSTAALFTLPGLAAPTARNYVGIDLGQAHDRTVVVVLNQRGELVYFKRFAIHEQNDGLRLRDGLRRILAAYPGVVGYVETNFNAVLLNLIYDAAPGGMITGWHTTAPNKARIINNLIYAIDARSITLPTLAACPDMAQVKQELEDYQTYKTANGWQFRAPAGGYDDCVMALALAAQAAHNFQVEQPATRMAFK